MAAEGASSLMMASLCARSARPSPGAPQNTRRSPGSNGPRSRRRRPWPHPSEAPRVLREAKGAAGVAPGERSRRPLPPPPGSACAARTPRRRGRSAGASLPRSAVRCLRIRNARQATRFFPNRCQGTQPLIHRQPFRGGRSSDRRPITARTPLFRRFDDLRPDRIQDEVPAQVEQVGVLVHQNALEPSLEQMLGSAMTPARCLRMHAIQVTHPLREPALHGLDEQVVMVVGH